MTVTDRRGLSLADPDATEVLPRSNLDNYPMLAPASVIYTNPLVRVINDGTKLIRTIHVLNRRVSKMSECRRLIL